MPVITSTSTPPTRFRGQMLPSYAHEGDGNYCDGMVSPGGSAQGDDCFVLDGGDRLSVSADRHIDDRSFAQATAELIDQC